MSSSFPSLAQRRTTDPLNPLRLRARSAPLFLNSRTACLNRLCGLKEPLHKYDWGGGVVCRRDRGGELEAFEPAPSVCQERRPRRPPRNHCANSHHPEKQRSQHAIPPLECLPLAARTTPPPPTLLARAVHSASAVAHRAEIQAKRERCTSLLAARARQSARALGNAKRLRVRSGRVRLEEAWTGLGMVGGRTEDGPAYHGRG